MNSNQRSLNMQGYADTLTFARTHSHHRFVTHMLQNGTKDWQAWVKTHNPLQITVRNMCPCEHAHLQ